MLCASAHWRSSFARESRRAHGRHVFETGAQLVVVCAASHIRLHVRQFAANPHVVVAGATKAPTHGVKHGHASERRGDRGQGLTVQRAATAPAASAALDTYAALPQPTLTDVLRASSVILTALHGRQAQAGSQQGASQLVRVQPPGAVGGTSNNTSGSSSRSGKHHKALAAKAEDTDGTVLVSLPSSLPVLQPCRALATALLSDPRYLLLLQDASYQLSTANPAASTRHPTASTDTAAAAGGRGAGDSLSAATGLCEVQAAILAAVGSGSGSSSSSGSSGSVRAAVQLARQTLYQAGDLACQSLASRRSSAATATAVPVSAPASVEAVAALRLLRAFTATATQHLPLLDSAAQVLADASAASLTVAQAAEAAYLLSWWNAQQQPPQLQATAEGTAAALAAMPTSTRGRYTHAVDKLLHASIDASKLDASALSAGVVLRMLAAVSSGATGGQPYAHAHAFLQCLQHTNITDPAAFSAVAELPPDQLVHAVLLLAARGDGDAGPASASSCGTATATALLTACTQELRVRLTCYEAVYLQAHFMGWTHPTAAAARGGDASGLSYALAERQSYLRYARSVHTDVLDAYVAEMGMRMPAQQHHQPQPHDEVPMVAGVTSDSTAQPTLQAPAYAHDATEQAALLAFVRDHHGFTPRQLADVATALSAFVHVPVATPVQQSAQQPGQSGASGAHPPSLLARAAMHKAAADAMHAIGNLAISYALAGKSTFAQELRVATAFADVGLPHRGLFAAFARRLVARGSGTPSYLRHVPSHSLMAALHALCAAWEWDRDAFSVVARELKRRREAGSSSGADASDAGGQEPARDAQPAASGGGGGGGGLQSLLAGLARSIGGANLTLAAAPDYEWSRGIDEHVAEDDDGVAAAAAAAAAPDSGSHSAIASSVVRYVRAGSPFPAVADDLVALGGRAAAHTVDGVPAAAAADSSLRPLLSSSYHVLPLLQHVAEVLQVGAADAAGHALDAPSRAPSTFASVPPQRVASKLRTLLRLDRHCTPALWHAAASGVVLPLALPDKRIAIELALPSSAVVASDTTLEAVRAKVAAVRGASGAGGRLSPSPLVTVVGATNTAGSDGSGTWGSSAAHAHAHAPLILRAGVLPSLYTMLRASLLTSAGWTVVFLHHDAFTWTPGGSSTQGRLHAMANPLVTANVLAACLPPDLLQHD